MSAPARWRTACPVCAAPAGAPVVRLAGVPVEPTALCPSHAEALVTPRADLDLVFCDRCGVMWNTAFDPDLLDYDADYENSLHFSPLFQAYAEELARRLVNRYGIRKKTVLEIGSGKGEFLTLICAEGRNRGVGFDPSYDGESEARASGSVRFVRELFGESSEVEIPDLAVCRHVLEHVPSPHELLQALRDKASESTIVYFEVPAGEYALEQAAVWDLTYPHVTVYTQSSLLRLFGDAGFRVLDVGFSFGGQYLWIEATPDDVRAPEPVFPAAALRPVVAQFGRALNEKQTAWRKRLARLNRMERVAVWGAGAKGTTFLNLVNRVGPVAVVDVNPRKRGSFVAGTGQRIHAPDELVGEPPSLVLVMNPIYVDEIRAQLAALGLSPAVEAV